MTSGLLWACVWAVVANVIAVLPSKRSHWPQAYALIAIGLPILVLVWIQNGAWVALLVLAAGASILRWPVRYLWAWLRRRLGWRGA
ncbi:MAG: DUF2484 family protein [Pseudomonadota bacterium]